MAGIYLHIPFCDKKCYYCDFFSTVSRLKTDSVLAVMQKELTLQAGYLPESKVDTIYFGGGTPSLLPVERVSELLEAIYGTFDCSNVVEVTMETNPDDLSASYLERLVATKINRLSIGIQSFDDELLGFMNRRHNAQQAKKAVSEAQRVGFDNITIDLMYGIPGLTLEGWQNAVKEALELDVQHISAYHLTIEPMTVFGKRAQSGKLLPIDEQSGCEQYDVLHSMLSEAGFEHYEISNFAKPGFRSKHNSSYWSSKPYLGIGPSAHSYNGKTRRWSEASIDKYIGGCERGECYTEELLTDTERHNEYIMTRLRTAEGLATAEFKFLFGEHRLRQLMANVGKFEREGVMRVNSERISIPPEHFMMSDAMICELFE